MKKTKIWVLTGASLLILGALVWVIAMSALKWDFYALDTTEYTPMHYAPQEGEQIAISSLFGFKSELHSFLYNSFPRLGCWQSLGRCFLVHARPGGGNSAKFLLDNFLL